MVLTIPNLRVHRWDKVPINLCKPFFCRIVAYLHDLCIPLISIWFRSFVCWLPRSMLGVVHSMCHVHRRSLFILVYLERHMITLKHSTRTCRMTCWMPCNQDGKHVRFKNHMNPIAKLKVETKSCQNTKKKMLIKGVKSFRNVKFESNITIMWFRI